MKRFISGILFLLALSAAAAAQKDVAPDAIRTTIIDAEGLHALVKETNTPLLINFWATWCGPCRAEFPDLVKIDRDYRANGLRFVIVSIDNPTLADTSVSDFLKSYGAEMPSYLIDFENRRELTRAVRKIAPSFSGGFPVTMLFSASGKLLYLRNGVISDRPLRAKIDKALAKQPSESTPKTLK